MTRAEPRHLSTALPLLLALACPGCAQQVDLVAVPVALDGATAFVEVCPDPEQVPPALAATLCQGAPLVETLLRPLCTCADLVASAQLRIDGADGLPAAEAAIDGAMQLHDSADVDGTLRVAGGQGLLLGEGHLLSVSGDLSVAAELAASGATIEVGGDAEVGGRVTAGSLSVAGILTLPEGANLDAMQPVQAGELRRAPVEVALRCACGPLTLPPLPATAAAAGDDAAALQVCGFAAVPALQSDGDVRVTGGGVLVVDGDVAVGGRLGLWVPPDAELQIWVRGNLRVDGGLQPQPLGGGRVHLWVVGDGTVQLGAQTVLDGSLTAPQAELVATAPVEITGGIAVRRAALSAPLTIHHDADTAPGRPAGCPPE